MKFDVVLIVDWSARSNPSPLKPSKDAIWIAETQGTDVQTMYFRTRSDAYAFIEARIGVHLAAGRRVLAGFDFAFGYPIGFAQTLCGNDNPFSVWDWLETAISDGTDNANNRFEVAEEINRAFPGIGPFWGRPSSVARPGVPEKGSERRDHDQLERRATEEVVKSAQPVWKLYTTGSVGSQVLMGLPYLNRLRRRFAGQISVWPFETPDQPLVLAEVYPSLLSNEVAAAMAASPGAIKDEVQVRLLARALGNLSDQATLAEAFEAPVVGQKEGWILGASAQGILRDAAKPDLEPPKFDNDCFALPAGVDWMPVDMALAELEHRLHPVTSMVSVHPDAAAGRILAKDVTAERPNPPRANSAVDGYGFAHVSTTYGRNILPLHPGRAAAGASFDGKLPAGSALRILTGAALPDGVDTVVLEEDTTSAEGHIAFKGPLKPGSNTRRAGEDFDTGDIVLRSGYALRPPDLALLSAAGVQSVTVRTPLKVGILSTGDELISVGTASKRSGIHDANRPQLLALVKQWGHVPVDLGIVPDSRDAVRGVLNTAAGKCDAILTSGGASAGDEDHISAILNAEGSVAAWRIALKPGRPLMLGAWRDTPLFGLPGNPVAAFVCALLFARPALAKLGGADWTSPTGFLVPAGFSKSKKAGRREYLRAQLDPDGKVSVFKSEGSGRISGISWADGLVELPDEACQIRPGDPVSYYPYSAFGIVT